MASPTTAFILAAGLGTRMRPLTHLFPKPMLPFRGKPILDHVAEQLASWGVRDFILNTHHLPASGTKWAEGFRSPERNVWVSHEPEILGTGGALNVLRGRLGDSPFWLANADVISRIDPAPLREAMKDARVLAALWMVPDKGPRTVRLENGRVVDFHSPDRGAPGTYTFSGLHLIRPELLNYIPSEGFSSILDAYRRAQAEGWEIAGCVCPDSWWADLGTPEDYLNAHFGDDPNASWIDPGATVEPGASLRRSVVWAGAYIESNAHVENAIVAGSVRVRGAAAGPIVPVGVGLTEAERSALPPEEDPCSGDFPATAIPLSARGSDRSYHRILRSCDSLILVRYGTERPENDLYAEHARFLEAEGIRACRVLQHNPLLRFSFLEDLGDRDLLHLVKAGDPKAIEAAYRQSLRLTAKLHHALPRAVGKKLPLQEGFGPALYRWEHDLFIEKFAHPFLHLSREQELAIREELQEISALLDEQPRVLLHRDLQSTNILFYKGEAALIDFQGMRSGPAAYDLGSLLADPYVELEESLQLRLLENYAEYSGGNVSLPIFYAGCIQRLVQALGAFGRLGALSGTRRFLEYISPGRRMLSRMLRRRGGSPVLLKSVNE